MNGRQLDLWGMLNTELSTINDNLCGANPEPIAPTLEKLLDELLAVAYDRDTTERQVNRIGSIMRLAFELGRGKQLLTETLNRRF